MFPGLPQSNKSLIAFPGFPVPSKAVQAFPDFRSAIISKPSAIACAPAVLLIHSDTTDGSTTFVDSSASGHILTPAGDTHHEDTQKVFGTTSIYFDGVNDGLTIPNSTDFNLTGDFTIDFRMYVETGLQYQTILDRGYLSWSDSFMIQMVNQKIYFHVGSSFGNRIVEYQLSVDTWYHIAFVRISGVLYLYVNGILQDSGSLATSLSYLADLHFGYRLSDSTWDYKGYLDEIRIANGEGIWTANFTPPTLPYVACAA